MNSHKLLFHLNIEQVNLIIKALVKLPFEEVAGLINDINISATKQIQEKEKENKLVNQDN